jgi:hypothetical protein
MAKRWRRVVLHIGLERTGSTALQTTLASMVDALRSRGILFPVDPSAGGHVRHQLLALGDDADPGVGPWDHATDGCSVLVLSDERLSARVQTTEGARRIVARLQRSAAEVRILVALRPQHDLLASRISIELRMGHPPTLDLSRVGPGHGWLDYRTLLQRWAAAAGDAHIDVLLHGSDVVASALQRIGVDAESIREPEIVHESLSGRAQNVVDWLNRSGLRADLDPRVFARVLELEGGRRLQPGRADRVALMRRLEESNDWVRRKWFPERPLLFDPVPEEHPSVAVRPDPRVAEQDFQQLLAEIEAESISIEDSPRDV